VILKTIWKPIFSQIPTLIKSLSKFHWISYQILWFFSLKILTEVEKTIVLNKKGKKDDFISKKGSNNVFSAEKSENMSNLSVFHNTPKSNLDDSFIKREDKVSVKLFL